MQTRIKFYFGFWWQCAADAWRGSWSAANTLSASVGGLLLAALAWWFGLSMDAPTSVEGVILFTLVITLLSILTMWALIYIVRLVGAPARLYEISQTSLHNMCQRAWTSEEAMKPKFRLSFHPEADGVAKTPTSDGYMATYVRIHVEASSATTVAGCKAFLTGLRKEKADGQSAAGLRLPHSLVLGSGDPFDVYPRMSHIIDILTCSSTDNKLQMLGYWPNELREVFMETGTFHFTITVNGGGLSDSITVSVGWSGRWDKIVGRRQVGQ